MTSTSPFNSKKPDIKESSDFYKHLQNTHHKLKKGQDFADFFLLLEIVKAYPPKIVREKEEEKKIYIYIYTVGAELAGDRVHSCLQDGSQRSLQNGVHAPPGPVDGGRDNTSNEPVQQEHTISKKT